MAGLLYEGLRLDNTRDEIRILHLLPKNSKTVLAKPETRIVETQDRRNVLQSDSQTEFVAKMEKKIQELGSESSGSVSSRVDSLFHVAAELEAFAAQNKEQVPGPVMSALVNANSSTSAIVSKDQEVIGAESLRQVSVVIEVVSLLDKPEYTALSYVWGDPTRLSKILVNEIEVRVTENLKIALEHFQLSDEIVTLWVDALCINQDDNTEKMAQVMKMKGIYQAASSVLAWLGPAADNSELVMGHMEKDGVNMLDQIQKTNALVLLDTTNAMGDFIQAQPAMRDLYSTPVMANYVEAVRSLLYREYWYRIWILQELVFAKKVTVACGSKQTSLEVFENCSKLWIKFFSSSSRHLVSTTNWLELANEGSIKTLTRSPTSSPAMRMLSERRWNRQKDQHRKLADLLIYAHTVGVGEDIRLRATNPRDRIYAMLGLTTDTDKLGITVDYEEPVENTYTRIARKLLSQDLGLLSMAQQKRVNGKLQPRAVPSWVPDWRLELDESPNYFATGSFRACGQSQQQPHNPNDEAFGVLELRGAKVDTVLLVGTVFHKDDNDLNRSPTLWINVQLFLSQIENFCHRSTKIINGVYSDQEQWLEYALYRIPVCDQEFADEAQNERRRLTGASEQRFKTLLAHLDFCNNYANLTSVAELGESLKGDWGELLTYLAVMHRSVGWKPLLTEKGYVCLGPAATRPGDVVCIFAGARVPYVVRGQDDGNYELVGEAYVHGIMDGEFTEKGPELETFRLA